jgi:mono/diheme cytochrome c family protein
METPMRIFLPVSPILLAACASMPAAAPSTSSDPRLAEGRMLAEIHCASCHAIGATGRSKHPEAPPFRTLSRNYPVDALAEPLAEGIMVGHPEMPEFRFRAEDVDSMIAYLESIQTK